MPTLYIIAGPNGAGKTTAAYSLLPDVFKTVEFVNADEIARGLSPLNVGGVALQAGRIMLERLDYLINKKENFAFETTLSGLTYLRFLRQAKEAGYTITFFYVWLNNFRLSIERVQRRVSKGGHHIPADVIERRYEKSIANFSKYAALADDWYVYNNSGIAYVLVAKFTNGNTEVFNWPFIINSTAMIETTEKRDLSVKIQAALDKAIEKVILEEKCRDGYLIVSDPEGNIKKIPAKDL